MRQRWKAKKAKSEAPHGSSDLDAMSVHSSGSGGTPFPVDLEPPSDFEDSLPAASRLFGGSSGWNFEAAMERLGDDESPMDGSTSFARKEDEDQEVRGRLPLVDGSSEPPATLSRGGSLPSSGMVATAFRATDFQQFKYPWEKGSLRKVFGNDVGLPALPSMKPSPRHFLPMEVVVDEHASMKPEIKVKPMVSSSALFLQAVKHGSNLAYLDERQEKRAHAVSLWWSLLANFKRNSSVGRMVLREAQDGKEDDYAMEILDASFSLKSPNTLLKRFYSIKGFYEWCKEVQKVDWLPMTEFLAWEYVKYLKSSQAAPTRASSFMESCRFCWYILGVDGSNAIESSLRVKGMTAQMKVTKRPWMPADCLTVSEVEELHRCLEDDTKHRVDRLLAGHLLHLLYARCRWADLLAVQNLMMDSDGVYLELETQVHKGAKATDMKAKLLPLVAPCVGVVSSNWAKVYVQLRESAGLVGPGKEPTHMMPAPDGDTGDKWLDRYVTSEEGADFLRALLNKKKAAGRRVSTHSMKSTAISWTSKYGLGMEVRAVLARHSSALSNPTVLYSRDIISSALRDFDGVLASIRNRSFEPDRTRSGMLTPTFRPTGMPMTPGPTPTTPGPGIGVGAGTMSGNQGWVKLETGAEQLDSLVVTVEDSPEEFPMMEEAQQNKEFPVLAEDSLSETSEEDSEQSTSSDEEGVDEQAGDQERMPAITIPISGYYINLQSSVLHCIRRDNLFRCGKKLTSNFKSVWELNGIRCSRCFDV